MLSYERAVYLNPYCGHVVEFNAGVWFAGGQVWWGDLDLTVDEGLLAGLAAETGETVYVVWEDDGRGRLRHPASHDQAIYWVSPDGAVGMQRSIYERVPGGRLAIRGLWRDARVRLPRRPAMWRFWRLRLHAEHWAGARGDDGSSCLALVLGERGAEGYPFLRLECAWFRNVAAGGWVEVLWSPSPRQHAWLPPFNRLLRLPRGPVRPWVALDLAPGERDRLQLGVVVGPKDPRWQ